MFNFQHRQLKERNKLKLFKLNQILNQKKFEIDLLLNNYSHLLTDLGKIEYVRRDLSLYNCHNLISLDNLNYVGMDLNLNGCSSLKEIPENLFVAGTLFLNDTQITYIPESCRITRILSPFYRTKEDGEFLSYKKMFTSIEEFNNHYKAANHIYEGYI